MKTEYKQCVSMLWKESAIIDWIFEKGEELDFLPKNQVKEFVKDRFNRSLESIRCKKVFKTDPSILEETEWFNDEIIGTKHGDFFVKRSINYSKRTQSITMKIFFNMNKVQENLRTKQERNNSPI